MVQVHVVVLKDTKETLMKDAGQSVFYQQTVHPNWRALEIIVWTPVQELVVSMQFVLSLTTFPCAIANQDSKATHFKDVGLYLNKVSRANFYYLLNVIILN